jgi:hypothetical protein
VVVKELSPTTESKKMNWCGMAINFKHGAFLIFGPVADTSY